MPLNLNGRRILVLEDEPLNALDVEATLADAGVEVLGPAYTEGGAIALIDRAISNTDRAPPIDGAALDVHLGDRTSETVAERLASLEVPFIFHSGFARDTEPFVAQSTAPHLRKPASPEDLIAALEIEV
ncbi:MAG: response regulator [Pseudomonadota bacterium]